MSSPAVSRGLRKGLRTVVQVAAGGALTALVTAVAGGLAPSTQAIVMGAWIAFVAFSQNWAETAGKVPVLLPTPGLISSVGDGVAVAVGTVDAVAEKVGDTVGEVTGTVQSVTGELLGEVVDVDHEED
jgi:phage-related protein